jgi:hypothetical protein
MTIYYSRLAERLVHGSIIIEQFKQEASIILGELLETFQSPRFQFSHWMGCCIAGIKRGVYIVMHLLAFSKAAFSDFWGYLPTPF